MMATFVVLLFVSVTILLLPFSGVDGQLTCGGCESNANNTEYYCMEIERYIYFRCESDRNQLIWNVSPLFTTPIVLNGVSSANNIFRRGVVSIFVDTVLSQSGENQIISYLWINVQEIVSEMNVSCENTGYDQWTLKPIGEDVTPPNIGKVHLVRNQITEEGMTVYYEWEHANFRELLCYNILTYHNDILIYNITLPRESVNGSHRLPQDLNEGDLHLEVEAVGLCRGVSSHAMSVSRSTTNTIGEDCLTNTEIKEYCATQGTSTSTAESASASDFNSGNIGLIVGSLLALVGIIIAVATVVITLILIKRNRGKVQEEKGPSAVAT